MVALSLFFLLSLVFFELALLFGGGVLILLVFRHQVVHVGLRLRELHLVHAFTGVPEEETKTGAFQRIKSLRKTTMPYATRPGRFETLNHSLSSRVRERMSAAERARSVEQANE